MPIAAAAAAPRVRNHTLVRQSVRAARARVGLALLVLPLVGGACAQATGASRVASFGPAGAAASVRRAERPDEVLAVSLTGVRARTELVLTGAPVTLLAGTRAQRGDTLSADSPFVVALPTDPFELQIATRSSVPYAGTMATIEYATVNAAGETVTVRAEGARMVVRRAAAGQPLLVAGAARRVETAKAVASR
ncbi:MAG TPA: hypothetical protein VFJ74_11995 [Gemmatimonadaceae bacterium]|nr:hypothetical protein [Gemmatimonadaceae bacterium]